MNIQKLKKDGMIKELIAEQKAKLNIINNMINNYLTRNTSILDTGQISDLLHDFRQLEDEIKSIKLETIK